VSFDGGRSVARALVATLPALVLAVLAFGSSFVAAETIEGSSSLSASADRIPHGETVAVFGSVEAEEPCEGGREVRLRSKLPGAAGWSLAATVTTGDLGGFRFPLRPDHTARYRAFLPATDVCEAVISPVVRTRVIARVDVFGSPNPVDAGDCTSLAVRVTPSKPGQQVLLQRRAPGGWRALSSVRLDDSSYGRRSLCYAWTDLGEHDLRAVWRAQDALNLSGGSRAVTVEVVRAWWMRQLDRLAADRPTSIALTDLEGEFLYQRADMAGRTPASNEKLLLSMALFDRFDPPFRVATVAAANDLRDGVVHGRLWIVGGGDPFTGREALGRLARRIADAGIRRVTGSVAGSTGPFGRDWFAPGWESDFPARHVAFPTALTFEGNRPEGWHVSDPERRAAEFVTERLRSLGVEVGRKAVADRAPADLDEIARIQSRTLRRLLTFVNVESSNFAAEVLGKLLGGARFGDPGTIAKGAAAIQAWAARHDVRVISRDASGLSYQNRLTARGIVRLLGVADAAPWGRALRESLPEPGEGTLEGRLGGVELMAKTGTLDDVSALSGWIRLERTGEWARFSILTTGYSEDAAKGLEDDLVRVISRYGR
jgi:D-alanyl-D-alanine carboxypeptidase